MAKKLAIVLFNLGGPDSLQAVQPFLFNLFKDPAIIGLPNPFRWLLAQLISKKRAPEACKNYAKMGGYSPLLQHTEAQSQHLENALQAHGLKARCFIAMRYWKPFTKDTVQAVKQFDPDQTLLLPLYPQFSTTTTGSSLKAWQDAKGPKAQAICCYPTLQGLAEAHAETILDAFARAGRPDNARILFSAHGLPEKIIASGDPYQWQIEQSVAAILDRIGDKIPQLDHEICYQSRVGPLKWIKPSTEEAIERAIHDERAMFVCPVAFVSEHIETLVELDEEYYELAKSMGGTYHRVPALCLCETFIKALAELVVSVLDKTQTGNPCSHTGKRLCSKQYAKCPMHMM